MWDDCSYRLPMYGELKLAFIIYLWYPKTKVTILNPQRYELISCASSWNSSATNKDWFICLWQGTGYIYETILRPFVTNHETELEKKLPEWRAKAWDLAIYYWQNSSDLGQSAIFQVLEYMAGQSGKSSKSSNKVRAALYSFCPFLLEISLLNQELYHQFLQKSSKKSSSPPPPPPNDTPTFYKPGKNMKHSQTSGSSSAPPRRATSEKPKSNTVQVHLDAKTEYVQVINDERETLNGLESSPSYDVPWSHSTKNKLYLPHISFRHSRA